VEVKTNLGRKPTVWCRWNKQAAGASSLLTDRTHLLCVKFKVIVCSLDIYAVVDGGQINNFTCDERLLEIRPDEFASLPT
jgi:hypothetical protein